MIQLVSYFVMLVMIMIMIMILMLVYSRIKCVIDFEYNKRFLFIYIRIVKRMNNSKDDILQKQIKGHLFSDPDFIKKSKINYLDCQLKDLHQGQKLVLVCIDPQCKNRGLICPVCKDQSHKTHEVIHIKVFLSELQSKIIGKPQSQDNQQSLKDKINTKTLSQYLNVLQNSRKSILNNLQESVKTLAQAVKDIQKKIQDQYLRIRRIILSQKSFQSRLPKIYGIMVGEHDASEKREQIKEEIKKLTELLQKNNKSDKIKVANNIDKIVESYVQNSDNCTTHILGLMTDLPKKITALPIKLKNILEDDEKDKNQKAKKTQYVFSQNLKATSLLLSEDKKSVTIVGPQEMGGIIFVDGDDHTSSAVRKINFKIISSISDSISVGVGDSQKMKLAGFILQQMQNEGLYGICAMGININDIETPTFVFAQGDIIQITYDPQQCKLTFGRRNGVEKQQILIDNISEEQAKKMKFFTNVVLYGESVEIVQ